MGVAAQATGLRLATFYGAIFLGLGIYLPFFPVWLKSQGFSAVQISAVIACQMAVRIGSGPAFSFMADAVGERRKLVRLLALAAVACLALMSLAKGTLFIVLLAVALAVFWTPILPLVEALGVLESEDGGADYGRTRLWGSLAFIAGSVGAGRALTVLEPELIIWFLVGAYLVMAVAAFWLPAERHPVRAANRSFRLAEAIATLKHPVFLAFLGSASLVQASHALYYGFGTIHWQSLGIADDVIGALWATGVIAEVVLFVFSRRSLAHAGPLGLIMLGGSVAFVRWSLTAVDPGAGWLFAIQVAHAFTFAAAHVGAVYFIARAAPRAVHATMQGVHAAFSGGVIMAAVMAASGPLYGAWSGYGYFAMAALGALGGLFALIAALLWDGGKLR